MSGASKVKYKYGGSAEQLQVEIVDVDGNVVTGCKKGTPEWDIMSSCSKDMSAPCIFTAGYIPNIPLSVLYRAAGALKVSWHASRTPTAAMLSKERRARV